ncbi:MAG: HAMP domain-containing protein [Armatimonadota bacterium]
METRPGRFRLRLRTLVLSVLLTSILVITVSMGALIYGSLYDAILESNERKLFAADVATGLFIDGDLHDAIYLKREINALAFDPAQSIIYGTDTLSNTLMTLDVTTDPALRGGATVVGPLGLPAQDLRGMTWDPHREALYALAQIADPRGMQSGASATYLLRIDTITGRARRLMPLRGDSGPFRGLAYDPVTTTLWTLSGSALWRVLPDTGQTVPVGGTGLTKPTALAYAAPTKTLYCLCSGERGLAQLDTLTGKASAAPKSLRPIADDADAVQRIRMQAMTFDTKSGELFGATRGLIDRDPAADSTLGAPTALVKGDRLGVINPVNGRTRVGSSVIGYRNEQSSAYRRYAVAMGHVRDRLGLTYVYTVVPDSDNWIRYVIDPTEGAEHTNIGWPDVLTDEHAQGLQQVIEHHDVYLSDIHAWERWGLLKTAYAPIYSHNEGVNIAADTGSDSEINTSGGISRAVAGMDINIDVIQTRTRSALTTVGCVALASLLLSAFTTLFLTRRLTSPIAQVKDAALLIASGQYGGRINVQEPRELAELATEFSRMSETMAGRLRTMEEENEKIARERCFLELDRSIIIAQVGPTTVDFPLDVSSESAPLITVSADRRIAFFATRSGNRSGVPTTAAERDGSNYILSPDGTKALLWFCDAPADPLEALRLHGDLMVIAARVLSHYGHDWAVKSLLEPLLSEQVYAWILIESEHDTISFVTNRLLNPHQFFPDDTGTGGTETVLTDMPPHLVPAKGGCLILRSDRGGLVVAVSGKTSIDAGNASSAGDAEACLKAILPRLIWESVPPSETPAPQTFTLRIGGQTDRITG